MLSYEVGIVGATGAVGKEIRQCLEKRYGELPVEKLRIFGSERSAGQTIETSKFGTVQVELFTEDAARQCDVVFLAVDGDFALKHAKNLSSGPNGCVVIDNSVRASYKSCCILPNCRGIFIYLYIPRAGSGIILLHILPLVKLTYCHLLLLLLSFSISLHSSSSFF